MRPPFGYLGLYEIAVAGVNGISRTGLASVLPEGRRGARPERNRLIMERGWPKGTAWMGCTANGTPLSERYLQRVFARVLHRTREAWKKAHETDAEPVWDGLSPHSLRHTFAVMHILDGCDPKWLQQQMGHASIKLTYDVYGDWFAKRDAAQANRGPARLAIGDKAGDRGA
jgi:integrase